MREGLNLPQSLVSLTHQKAMMVTSSFPCLLLMCVGVYASKGGSVSLVESGASGLTWSPKPSQQWVSGTPPDATKTFTVDRAAVRQEILGFGSCFTDTSAYNALVYMTPAIRDQYVEAFWGESGLQASVMRVHINSPDYAVHSYNMDNVTDDFSLASFDGTLAYDSQRVIPMIKLAMAKVATYTTHPIKLFGSPWSPPGWMKNNNNMINSDAVCLKNDTAAGDSYRQTWANYIVKWLEAFAAQGIDMWGLTPQNEPGARQGRFESCAYDVPHYVDFVGNYLGPTVHAKFPHLQIMGFDHNKQASLSFMDALYSDANASTHIAGTALHWYDYQLTLGLDKLDAIHAISPGKFMLNTEACYLDSLTFDFENTGFLFACDIIADLNHFVGGWVSWNSVLLAGDKYPESYGGPNHDNTTQFGNGILLEFNASGTQRLIFQSEYWVMGHFSKFMLPGSLIVASQGDLFASDYVRYEAIRNRTVVCAHTQCEPIPGVNGLGLLGVGYVNPTLNTAGAVVANPNPVAIDFDLYDLQGERHTACTIPPFSIQSYSFSTD